MGGRWVGGGSRPLGMSVDRWGGGDRVWVCGGGEGKSRGPAPACSVERGILFFFSLGGGSWCCGVARGLGGRRAVPPLWVVVVGG